MKYLTFDLDAAKLSLEKAKSEKSDRHKKAYNRLSLGAFLIFDVYAIGGFFMGYNWGLAVVGILFAIMFVVFELLALKRDDELSDLIIKNVEEIVNTYPADEKKLNDLLSGYKLVGDVELCEGNVHWFAMDKTGKSYQLIMNDVVTDTDVMFYSLIKVENGNEIVLITYMDEKCRLFIPA